MAKPKGPNTARGGKDDLLQVRVGPLEKQGFQKAAALAGIGVSAWARERLRRAAMRELDEAAQPIPFLQSAILR